MTIPELESAVTQLSRKDIAVFARWFEEYLADEWDRQIERDIHARRLDEAGRRADIEFEQERCTPL